jgi:hypothetical protein
LQLNTSTLVDDQEIDMKFTIESMGNKPSTAESLRLKVATGDDPSCIVKGLTS